MPLKPAGHLHSPEWWNNLQTGNRDKFHHWCKNLNLFFIVFASKRESECHEIGHGGGVWAPLLQMISTEFRKQCNFCQFRLLNDLSRPISGQFLFLKRQNTYIIIIVWYNIFFSHKKPLDFESLERSPPSPSSSSTSSCLLHGDKRRRFCTGTFEDIPRPTWVDVSSVMMMREDDQTW